VVAVDGNLQPARRFDQACDQVLRYLSAAAPMGMWAVTRVAHGRQTMLAVDGSQYDVRAGDHFPFDASMCRSLVAAEAPQIAADVSEVPAYAVVAADYAAQGLMIGAYVGAPIVHADGELFGTVCGVSTAPGPAALHELQPLLGVFTSLLSAVLEADTASIAGAREVERARSEADVDALTGLLNRRGWERVLAAEEERFRRFGDTASVVMLDLDQLKDVNDRLGHAAGDRHIQAAADVLRSVSRTTDVLARLGGDEFAVLVVGADPAQAAELAQRMEEALDHHGVGGSVGHAPYSIVAGFPGALQAADTAMYERKQQRRQTSDPSIASTPSRRRQQAVSG
jgi:diguanylate cyclase